MSTPHTTFPSSEHDHRACIRTALRDAEHICKARGLRLTPIRRRVLELIWRSHRPSGGLPVCAAAEEGSPIDNP